MIQIGDYVVVKNFGENYSRYAKAFIRFKFKDTILNDDRDMERDTIFKVIGDFKHEWSQDTRILGLRSNKGEELAVGEKGCKLYRKFLKLNRKVKIL
jgi:hypothetical protein